jgi:hypothetical protein
VGTGQQAGGGETGASGSDKAAQSEQVEKAVRCNSGRARSEDAPF